MSGAYKDLEVWQAAMELAVQVYRLTAAFPKEERYGLTSQMRRAAVSVPSNIAEGKGRSSDKELIQFLCHSRGSRFEIELNLRLQRNWTIPRRNTAMTCERRPLALDRCSMD